MRAGKLDRTISIQSYGETVDEDGTVVSGWTDYATVRAQLIQGATDEFIEGYGEDHRTVLVFRVRWLAGVTTDHCVLYEGTRLNIRETKEIGRRKGLEIRCEGVRV